MNIRGHIMKSLVTFTITTLLVTSTAAAERLTFNNVVMTRHACVKKVVVTTVVPITAVTMFILTVGNDKPVSGS
jgi:hypothetical protein